MYTFPYKSEHISFHLFHFKVGSAMFFNLSSTCITPVLSETKSSNF